MKTRAARPPALSLGARTAHQLSSNTGVRMARTDYRLGITVAP